MNHLNDKISNKNNRINFIIRIVNNKYNRLTPQDTLQ